MNELLRVFLADIIVTALGQILGADLALVIEFCVVAHRRLVQHNVSFAGERRARETFRAAENAGRPCTTLSFLLATRDWPTARPRE